MGKKRVHRDTISWWKFRAHPKRYRGSYKVVFRDGYLLVDWYSHVRGEGDFVKRPRKKDKRGKKIYQTSEHRCELCGNIWRYVIFVMPYNLKYSPGYYCYDCRKKNSILDIKSAKRYGKIF